MNTNIMSILEELRKIINDEISLYALDLVLNDAMQYIEMHPNALDYPDLQAEVDCIYKIKFVLDKRGKFHKTNLCGDRFQDFFLMTCHGIEDKRMRDMLANMLLWCLEDEPELIELLVKVGLMTVSDINQINSREEHMNTSPSNSSHIWRPSEMRLNGDCSDESMTNYIAKLQDERKELPNHELVQNAIYAFLGIPGTYLLKNGKTNRMSLNEETAAQLSRAQCGMLMRFSELGYYHDCLVQHSTQNSGANALGTLGLAFICQLKLLLNRYHGEVAQLQDVHSSNRQKLSDVYAKFGDCCWSNEKPHQLKLLTLLAWSVGPLRQLQLLNKIATHCHWHKGGALVSRVCEFLYNGDPILDEVSGKLMRACCAPLMHMISTWMIDGRVEDVDNEFFIESLVEIDNNRLWYDKIQLRPHMLPSFISKQLAEKILKTGKNVLFMRKICGMTNHTVKHPEQLRDIIENRCSKPHNADWVLAIENCYAESSKQVLDIMVGPHKLIGHLQGMRRYLLLGQGDFVNIFIEKIKDELDKVGSNVYSYNLCSMLDAALRGANAHHDDPEIMEHLDVVVRTPYPGDFGWDVISLLYSVPGPVSMVLEPVMPQYKTLFKPLWRMKYMEFILGRNVWKEQTRNAKALWAIHDEISAATYKLHLFTAEIMHFVHEILYHVLFEVIECNWTALVKRLKKASDLDEILDLHAKFLDIVSIRSFAKSSQATRCCLETVYISIMHLDSTQQLFYNDCFMEIAARKHMEDSIAESERAGRFGVTTEMMTQRLEERKLFKKKVSMFRDTLDSLAINYRDAIGAFLLELNSSSDTYLRMFGTRLDFNEFYKKKDINLCKPLTFELMRLSSVMGDHKSRTAGRFSIRHNATLADF
ncbi:gamma-tubulin complex component 3-like isoform X2 [Drosophila nasuta]|uniref:gamma-tubulin complex component 3-like isoform X2 n=1 Tax=Drosophila nasuta TaxID=42062 RepID=UPI00295E2E49|nr:gamma-tubulin complex component 3-like isoform X2 [Drosophila nasuta]